jgi:hypothetical protein
MPCQKSYGGETVINRAQSSLLQEIANPATRVNTKFAELIFITRLRPSHAGIASLTQVNWSK